MTSGVYKRTKFHRNKSHFKKGQQAWNKGLVGYKKGKENSNWKGGRPKCIDCGKPLVAYSAKKCTYIELILYTFLKDKKIKFEKQKLIGRFLVDAYIPSKNLVIEVDGKYWHNLDRVKKKDKAENAYLLKCGYNLLRIDEDAMLNGDFKLNICL